MMLEKDDCLERMAAARQDEVVITTMSVVVPWERWSNHPLDFASANSAMGHAADFAYGLAMAQPQRRVITLNGDGSMLMCLGTLVTMAQRPLSNLALVITENGRYEVTGNQLLPAFGRFSFAALARAAGLTSVREIGDEASFEEALPELLGAPGPVVHIWKLKRDQEGPPKPADPMRDRAWRLKVALAEKDEG